MTADGVVVESYGGALEMEQSVKVMTEEEIKMEVQENISPKASAQEVASIMQRSPSKPKREVSFGFVTVREYAMTLSENPSCSYGPPVQLDWIYHENENKQLDYYEATRSKRRSMRQMVLNYYRRMDILKSAGYSEGELKRVKKAMNKVKRQKEAAKFFAPVSRVTDALSSVGGGLRRGRKSN